MIQACCRVLTISSSIIVILNIIRFDYHRKKEQPSRLCLFCMQYNSNIHDNYQENVFTFIMMIGQKRGRTDTGADPRRTVVVAEGRMTTKIS